MSDKREKAKPKCIISFEDGANIYSGLSSLRTAVKKYLEFCGDENNN